MVLVDVRLQLVYERLRLVDTLLDRWMKISARLSLVNKKQYEAVSDGSEAGADG